MLTDTERDQLTKTQAQVNKEMSIKWEKEMSKRNDYFKQFGITTVTFSDSMLKDLPKCFDSVAKCLSSRAKEVPSLNQTLAALNHYKT